MRGRPGDRAALFCYSAVMRKSLIAIALLLAACGEDRPPAPTAEENERLNEAEAMLNEEGPEAEAPDPSYSD